MPIYEYECANCGYRFEALQKFSDAPLTKCPECGQEQLGKLMSAASFHLKGKGWYASDYKKDAKAGGDEDGGSGSDTGDSKGKKGGCKSCKGSCSCGCK